MKSIYQQAAEYLCLMPENIEHIWQNPHRYVPGCLFFFMGPRNSRLYGERCGCLTQLKAWNSPRILEEKETDKLTWAADFFARLNEDVLMPNSVSELTPGVTLYQMALYQEEADKHYSTDTQYVWGCFHPTYNGPVWFAIARPQGTNLS